MKIQDIKLNFYEKFFFSVSMYFSFFFFADSGHPTTAGRPGFGASADGDGWAAPPPPAPPQPLPPTRSSLVLPPRGPQPQGSCSPPQGPSGGQAKSLQPPPRAHLLLFPCCRGHWPKDTQLTASRARFTPRARGPGRDAGGEDRTYGGLRRTGGRHQTGHSSDQHCPAARL